MNLNKYLDTINSIEILIENLTLQDVEGNIADTEKKIDYLELQLQDRIKKQRNNLPYSKIRIEFLSTVKMSVRSGTEKASIELLGRDDFNIVGYSENNFIILQKNKWDKSIGFKIYISDLSTRVDKKNEAQLIYNEYNDVGSGMATRSSSKNYIHYRIISLS